MSNARLPITDEQSREHLRIIADYYDRSVPPSTAVFNGIKAILIAGALFLIAGLVVWTLGYFYGDGPHARHPNPAVRSRSGIMLRTHQQSNRIVNYTKEPTDEQ